MSRDDQLTLSALSPVLIANRGEIAVRIARTCRRLGLETVGAVSDADHLPVHADAVDLAVSIRSYLDPDELVRGAQCAGARSVHPGYGFLSENPEFARAVEASGLVWIGPPAEAIELMGDKGRAKQAAAEAGVPVLASGSKAGYPLIIKAVAGGGGKGMRVVRAAGELETALDAAKREASTAFGDDRVLIERYVERPRHIEVQVLADRHGNCLTLGERECSLQRRHQKVIEEAPSPVVDDNTRTQLSASARSLAAASGYEGVGTVEFVADRSGSEFFFLEMNTRLQVEHPVTELVYGVDLVEQQLRVAAGAPLAMTQGELRADGHAIEARLYAEDPRNGFLPATGAVHLYREPVGEGIRVDSGIRSGTEVSTAFDPLLAKVIAHGPDRPTAIARLDRALADFGLLGVPTNAAVSRELLAREEVRHGEQDTGLLERILDQVATDPPEDLLAAGVVATAGTAVPPGPWRRQLQKHGVARVVAGTVTVGERIWDRVSLRHDQLRRPRVTLDGIERVYDVVSRDDTIWVGRDGHQVELKTERTATPTDAITAGALDAPMPGTVLLVAVEAGKVVSPGDVLVVVESMKMELSVTAPDSGTVSAVHVAPGERVAQNQPLVSLDPLTGVGDSSIREEAHDE